MYILVCFQVLLQGKIPQDVCTGCHALLHRKGMQNIILIFFNTGSVVCVNARTDSW